MIEIQNEYDDERRKDIWKGPTNENKKPGFFKKYGGYFCSVIFIICLAYYYDYRMFEDRFFIYLISNICGGLFIGGLISFLNSLITGANFQRNLVIGCVVSCICWHYNIGIFWWHTGL